MRTGVTSEGVQRFIMNRCLLLGIFGLFGVGIILIFLRCCRAHQIGNLFVTYMQLTSVTSKRFVVGGHCASSVRRL